MRPQIEWCFKRARPKKDKRGIAGENMELAVSTNHISQFARISHLKYANTLRPTARCINSARRFACQT